MHASMHHISYQRDCANIALIATVDLLRDNMARSLRTANLVRRYLMLATAVIFNSHRATYWYSLAQTMHSEP